MNPGFYTPFSSVALVSGDALPYDSAVGLSTLRFSEPRQVGNEATVSEV
jgi:hypothetical protein